MNLLITGTFYASDMKNISNKSKYDAVLQASKLLRIQLPLGSLRTFDVTHSRLVTHLRILKIKNVKI